MHNQETGSRYAFDGFELVSRTLELFKNGQPVRIQRQPAQVLALLIERSGELVSRDELRDRIWGDERFVDFDRSLGDRLHQIRAALGDDSREPRYVETLRGLGYRFIGRLTSPVTTLREEAPIVKEPTRSRGRRVWRVATAAAALALAATAAAPWVSVIGRADPGPPNPIELSSADVLLRRAGEYYRRGRRDDVMNALAVYRLAVSVAPASPRARAGVATTLSWLAAHHRDAREAELALVAASEASRLAPNDPEVLAARAWGLHVAGRLTEAADAYRTVLRLEPSRTELLDSLALLEHQRGRLDEGVRLLTNRWQTTQPDPRPAGLLGVMLTELGFEPEARGWTRLAISMAPDDPQATYFEGLMAYRAGRLDEAEARLTAAAAAPDPGALLIVLYSLVMALRHSPAAALAPLEAAAHSMPESSDVHVLLAEVYRAVGRHDDARRTRSRVVEICRRGVEVAPENPAWPRCLASQAAIDGDREGAVTWYGRAADRGWRKLKGDRTDGGLALVAGDPRIQAIQRRIADDIAHMRRIVEANGVPKAIVSETR